LQGSYIVLYADDILILSPSICQLEVTLRISERELDALDMAINFKKSSCMRVDPRHDVLCSPICSISETTLPWVKQIRYLGIFVIQSCKFKWSLDNAKKSIYRCANAIFGEIGRFVSEEVVLQLIISKCLSILLT